MNRYGQLAMDHYRRHRPTELAAMSDPTAHFTMLGEQTQQAISDLRDTLLGQPGTTESPEDYRLRSYRALRQAEEITMTEILIAAELTTEVHETSPNGNGLDELNTALSRLGEDWMATPTDLA